MEHRTFCRPAFNRQPDRTVARLSNNFAGLGRFSLVKKGAAPLWENFGSGVWASDTNYDNLVLAVYGQMRAYAAKHGYMTGQ